MIEEFAPEDRYCRQLQITKEIEQVGPIDEDDHFFHYDFFTSVMLVGRKKGLVRKVLFEKDANGAKDAKSAYGAIDAKGANGAALLICTKVQKDIKIS